MAAKTEISDDVGYMALLKYMGGNTTAITFVEWVNNPAKCGGI